MMQACGLKYLVLVWVVICGGILGDLTAAASGTQGQHRTTYGSDRSHVKHWFSAMNSELRELNSAAAILTWRLSTEERMEATDTASELGEMRSAWRNQRCQEAVDLWPLVSNSERRQLYLLCRGPVYLPQQSRDMTVVSGKLLNIYTTSRVCRRHGEPCYSGEPDLERLMKRSRDPAELLWAWQEWRRVVGPPSKYLFTTLVDLQNQVATNNGYADMGEVWREELETPELEKVIEKLYQMVEPLYMYLHAFVRHKLVQYYGEEIVKPTGTIPAHFLGNMWAQSWDALTDIVVHDIDLGAALAGKNYTVQDMVRRAEDFYTSLGLEPMTSTFWAKSQVEGVSNTTCHGTAANMYTPQDYRMLLCAEVNMDDFYVIHHEMGHIEYYMAYEKQPIIFQDGANSAFQEAVGDAIMYAVMSPQHLQRLGLINDSVFSPDTDLQLLLRQALAKIPQLPFGLLMDKWRWGVFSGDITPKNYNQVWWELVTKYQGIAPPVPRSADDFDPAAKFHIPDGTPYVRYFLGGFLQVQMLKAMCEGQVGGTVPLPLRHCDIYGSKEAGTKLRSMMSLGSSKPWQEALRVMTGETDYSAEPLLEYYQPLFEWLVRYAQQHHLIIGWQE